MMTMSGWWLLAIPAAPVAASRIYCAVANAIAGEDEVPPAIPRYWYTHIRRTGFWWAAEGIYSGPEFTNPQTIVSGWAWTRKAAITQVAYWIADAAAVPAEWMPAIPTATRSQPQKKD